MMFFAQLGLGLLSNMVAGSAQQAQSQAQNAQAMATMRATLTDTSKAAMRQAEEMDPNANPFAEVESKAPPFPDKAAQLLQQRQETNAAQRQELLAETRDELAEMKTGFFEDHHLETKQLSDGREKVVLNQEGKPNVLPGKETPNHKVARETFEATRKEALNEQHVGEKESFVQEERQQLTTFLQNNKPDLQNPAVQGELQKALMLSHKKALNLQREHEEEALKADLYTAEQIEHADTRLSSLRDMEERHAKEEDGSSEAGELYQHSQDMAEMLRQRREEAKQTAMEEMFLRGRPTFNAEAQQPQGEVDVASVLPPHLANTLYSMEIYTV